MLLAPTYLSAGESHPSPSGGPEDPLLHQFLRFQSAEFQSEAVRHAVSFSPTFDDQSPSSSLAIINRISVIKNGRRVEGCPRAESRTRTAALHEAGAWEPLDEG